MAQPGADLLVPEKDEEYHLFTSCPEASLVPRKDSRKAGGCSPVNFDACMGATSRASSRDVSILLISGFPAAGKSYFGSWLEENHSYLHLDVEKDGRLGSYGLLRPWQACFEVGDVADFIRALDGLRRPVALNWGFPPRWLSVVKRFKAAGVTLWWFDADHAAARAAFLARGDVSIETFNVQMAAINSRLADIKAAFEPNVIMTLHPDGTRGEADAIYRRMFDGKGNPA